MNGVDATASGASAAGARPVVAVLGDRTLDAAQLEARELRRARHALAYLKDRLGNDAVRRLVAEDTATMTALARSWLAASGGRWRTGTVVLDLPGPPAAAFLAWYQRATAASPGHDHQQDLRAGHPEHFVNRPTPQGLEVIENIGETDLPWRVFYRSLPETEEFPFPWDATFPLRFGAQIVDGDGVRVGFTQHALRDADGRTELWMASTLPSAAPAVLMEHHVTHMAIEFTNWAAIARGDGDAAHDSELDEGSTA